MEQLSSQVTTGGGAAYQRTCFSRAEAVELDASDLCNLSCSSSWSMASSNDKEAEWEGTGRGRPRTLLRRVKSLRAKGKVGKSKRLMGLRRFLSRSEENIAVSEAGKQEAKSRSLERSLVFKEPAEILTPKKTHHSSSGQPLKSILKQPGALHPGRPDKLRSPSPDRKTLQDKASFSRFLDEITSRVLSPTNLQTTQRRGAGPDDESPLSYVRTPGNGSGSRADEGRGRRMGHRRTVSPGHPRGRRRSAERRHERAAPPASHSKERCQTPSEQGYLDTESLSSASHWSPEGKSPSPRTSPSLQVSAPHVPSSSSVPLSASSITLDGPSCHSYHCDQ